MISIQWKHYLRQARDRSIADPRLTRLVRRSGPTDRSLPGLLSRIPRVSSGLPPALEPEVAGAAAAALGQDDVAESWFVVLNGWKASAWTTRVFLRSSSGSTVSIICKAAHYDEEVPAVEGLPLEPGPPEMHVLDQCAGADLLIASLTSRPLAVTRVNDRRFQFVLEDLGRTHRALPTPNGILASVDHLPELHVALAELEDAPGFLDYAAAFGSTDFADYVREHISAYETVMDSSGARAVTARLDELTAGCTEPEWPEAAVCRIHGDPNPTNVLHARRNPSDVRFIDWEWVGRGLAHADLACLTKRLGPADEVEAINRFARSDPSMGQRTHQRLYHQAKLARSLLDASFLSAQSGHERAGVTFDIEAPLGRAIEAADQLT